jgi:hypothetical protein
MLRFTYDGPNRKKMRPTVRALARLTCRHTPYQKTYSEFGVGVRGGGGGGAQKA